MLLRMLFTDKYDWIFVAIELPDSIFASVFSGAFNAMTIWLPNSEFHLSNMEITSRVNTGRDSDSYIWHTMLPFA